MSDKVLEKIAARPMAPCSITGEPRGYITLTELEALEQLTAEREALRAALSVAADLIFEAAQTGDYSVSALNEIRTLLKEPKP